jgi:Ca2+-binding RTX toxin-like protein
LLSTKTDVDELGNNTGVYGNGLPIPIVSYGDVVLRVGNSAENTFVQDGQDIVYIGGPSRQRIIVTPIDNRGTIIVRTNGDTLGPLVVGPHGRIRIHGLSGNDRISVGAIGRPVWIDGGNGNDQIHGGTGDDVLIGGFGNDLINGGGGDNWIDGEAGNDQLFSRDGKDTLFGGHGNDHLSSGSGDDYLEGNDGDDQLIGGAGWDVLLGVDGDDWLDGGSGADLINGGRGDDVLHGQSGNDILIGGSGEDRLNGGKKHDVLIGGIANLDLQDLMELLVSWAENAPISTPIDIAPFEHRDDNNFDRLLGGAGQDLLIVGNSDVVQVPRSNDHVLQL